MALASKFRGSLIGGLIGDCLGAPFEGDFPVSRTVLINFITKQLEDTNKAFQIFPYTDDTAMAKSVAESLIEMKEFNPKDMAKRFTLEYYRQPKRGYGSNVIDVFAALKLIDYELPYEPAKLQFNGSGSYGNGGAMRIAPVALYSYHLPEEQLIELASNCAKLTHAHRNGFNGAILQCLAVRQALNVNVNDDQSFDTNGFLNNLIDKMEIIEKSDEIIQTNAAPKRVNIDRPEDPLASSVTPFTDKLKHMKKIFESTVQGSDLSSEEIAVLFGNDVSAFKSVPSAIYSVLRAQKVISDYETDSKFVRTLYLALSLGGDTDTIACMACSIAGALYGNNAIPIVLQKHCEDIEVIAQLSNKLHDLVFNKQ